jgi:hypothetical protein
MQSAGAPAPVRGSPDPRRDIDRVLVRIGLGRRVRTNLGESDLKQSPPKSTAMDAIRFMVSSRQRQLVWRPRNKCRTRKITARTSSR